MKKLITLSLAAFAAAALAQADDFPNRPIKIIVPFTTGSGSDAMARFYADKMGPILGQAVIVENRPGANGAIGMSAVKNLPADGYTLVQGGIGPSVINQVLVKDLPYDPVADFKAVYAYGRNMNILLTSPQSKFKSFADLQREAKASQVPVSVGTFSSTLMMSSAWMAANADLKINNIPYKGQSQVMTDIMGGQLDLALVDISGAALLVKQGKVRALLVTGENRSPDFPDVPTAKELGLGDYVQYSWNAFFVREETPEPIRRKLSDALRQVVTSPDTINNFYKPRGSDVRAVTPEEMRALQQREIASFGKVAQSVGLTK